ncbi:MAG: hypothetical protein AB7V32_09645 [Candidatus Berkiella sp.]
MLGPRFDVQGLTAIWTSEELKGIVSGFKLKIDDKFLQDQNLSMENVLAEMKGVLNTAERSLDFAKLDSSQPIIQKNVEQTKINFLIRAALFKNLEKEAMEHFQKIQNIQELRAAFHDYITRISEANYQKMVAEIEAQLLAQQQREIDQMVLAELDRMNKEAQAEWDAHQKHIEHLDNKIHGLRQQRQQVWEKYENQVAEAVANFKTSDGKQPFADLNQEQLKQFTRDYAQEGEKLEQKISQLQHSISKDEKRIDELYKEEQLLMAQIRAQEGPKIAAKQQERDKKDGILAPQHGLERKLNLKIDNDPKIQGIRKEMSSLQTQIQEKREKLPEYKNELDNLLKTYLKKHYTPQQIDEMFKNNPNLEKEFKQHMESNQDYMNYKMEIGKVNKEVFDLKGEKENVSKENKILGQNTESINIKAEQEFNIKPPTPTPGGFLAKRKAMQNSI